MVTNVHIIAPIGNVIYHRVLLSVDMHYLAIDYACHKLSTLINVVYTNQ